MNETHEITAILKSLADGDDAALGELFAGVYDHLHEIAHAQRRRWRGDDTLNTTALIHEAYLKISAAEDPRWEHRGHFFAVAARAIRHILVDRARRVGAEKRGGDRQREPLAGVDLPVVPREARTRLLALDQALERLERHQPRQAMVVQCRFFAGLGIQETAEAVGVSTATVERDWRAARVWLYDQIAGGEQS